MHSEIFRLPLPAARGNVCSRFSLPRKGPVSSRILFTIFRRCKRGKRPKENMKRRQRTSGVVQALNIPVGFKIPECLPQAPKGKDIAGDARPQTDNTEFGLPSDVSSWHIRLQPPPLFLRTHDIHRVCSLIKGL